MTVTLDLETLGSNPSTRRSLIDLSLSVAKCKKIVVVTGAGISCSCGIPDFRSSDGLYNLVKQQYPDMVLKGRDLFDASLFRDSTSTSIFYTFISQLKQAIDNASPSPTHDFIKALDSKKKLLRSYTQNIDGLEDKCGLLSTSNQEAKSTGKGKSKVRTKDVRNVQLHGDIHRVRCTVCSADFLCSQEHLSLFNTGVAPDCPECSVRSKARMARSARPLKIGNLRPAIVLYDEPHPLGDDIGAIQTADLARKPDMLIIMGTSLKVHGLKRLVKEFAKTVRGSSLGTKASKNPKSWMGKVIFVNKTAPSSEWTNVIDYHVKSETDKWVQKVLEDWKRMRPADWEVQQTLDESGEGDGFKVVKNVTNGVITKIKKSKANAENRPPVDVFDALFEPSFSPATSPCTSPASSAPSTPSKRRQSSSHYSDVESSPSKKRDIAAGVAKIMLAESERGLLFSDSTNKQDSIQDGQDECRPGLEASEASGKTGRKRANTVTSPSVHKSSAKRTFRRVHTEVWVEVQTSK